MISLRGAVLPAIMMASICASTAVAADIYKWIDDNGSVNYASKPPAGRAAKTLDAGASRLTIYQSNIHEIERRSRAADAQRIASRPVEAPATAVASLPYPALPVALPGGSESAYRELWLKRCREDRRVDCDDPFAFFGYGAGVPYYPYGPVAIVPPPRRVSLPVVPGPVSHAPDVPERKHPIRAR